MHGSNLAPGTHVAEMAAKSVKIPSWSRPEKRRLARSLEHQRTLDQDREESARNCKPIVRPHPSIDTKRAWRAAIALMA